MARGRLARRRRPLIGSVSAERSRILNGAFELRYQHLIIPEQQKAAATSGHKRRDDKESAAMAPIWQVWAERGAGGEACEAVRGKGADSAPPPPPPHPSTVPRVLPR